MTPERLAEIRKQFTTGELDLHIELPMSEELFAYIEELKSLCQDLQTSRDYYIEKKDREIAALKDESVDQLRVDAERWRVTVQVMDETIEIPAGVEPEVWMFSLPRTDIPGDIAADFTAAIDALRTQKAPG